MHTPGSELGINMDTKKDHRKSNPGFGAEKLWEQQRPCAEVDASVGFESEKNPCLRFPFLFEHHRNDMVCFGKMFCQNVLPKKVVDMFMPPNNEEYQRTLHK